MKPNFPTSIFREYDIRGLAEKEINEAFAYRLGLAYSAFIRKHLAEKKAQPHVSLGWDCRLTSPQYAESLCQGLVDSGLKVTRLGTCPTPLTYFSVFDRNLDGGIMITGSHNPSEYNGFKICFGKGTLFGPQIQELRKLIETLPEKADSHGVTGTTEDLEIIPLYLEHLLKNARKIKPMKIVIDAGNATASTVAPILFEKLGCHVVPLFCELDGRFPNHHPDPTVPKNLKDLIRVVREEKADLGLAYDGDSDRLGVVDDQGKILFGDELMVVFSRQILKETPGATIISEVKSSHRLYTDIAQNGGTPVMWKTGHSLIKSKMKETGALLAGEMSGHLFFADRYFGFDDAIYASLRLIEILSETDRPLSDLLSDLPPSVSTPEIRLDCEESLKFKLVEATLGKLRKSSELKITDIDGVRADFGDGWGLVRASNTQPVIVLRFEAPSSERLEVIQNQVLKALSEASTEVGHPPLNLEMN